MLSQLHFIAGLPRSGSTLLSGILKQNPRCHASITSPLASIFERLMQSISARSDYAEMLHDGKRTQILRGLFRNYYEDVDRPVVFDTNRAWCARMAAINLLFPSAQVICCVRDPAWILDSFERLYQASPLKYSKMFTPEQVATCHTRMEALASAAGVVGYAYDAFAEAFYGPLAGNLVVLDYDQFVAEPKAALEMLHAALQLPAFAYDFDRVELFDGDDFDRRFGVPGLHRIRPKVAASQRATILPPDLFRRYSGRAFWRENQPAG